MRVLSLYVTGFVFSPYVTSWQIHVETEMVYTVLPILLWNAANYLVATISDGEGRLRHVIIGSAYSLFPYALFALPIALISNLLTLNEVFIYNFSTQLMWFWCGMMLVIMVKEIHNYSFSETMRNILTTLFTMAMFLLTGYILYVLFNQLLSSYWRSFRRSVCVANSSLLRTSPPAPVSMHGEGEPSAKQVPSPRVERGRRPKVGRGEVNLFKRNLGRSGVVVLPVRLRFCSFS